MDRPFVTVIMPIRNEADYISTSLKAALVQDYPADCIEVLIADGMSTDTTRKIIADVAREHPNRAVRVVDNPRKIVPTGFNLALAQAKGDIIVRVDGHTVISPDYVGQCVEALERTDADNVGGRMNAVGRTSFGHAVALATSSRFGVGGARFHYSDQDEWVDTVYMGAWRRSAFDKFGRFDEEFVRNQDDELNYRIRDMGGRILLLSRIKSFYYNRTTLKSLILQYYQYGYWKVRVIQKHPQQLRLRQLMPLALVLVILAGGIASLFDVVISWGWFFSCGFYATANLISSYIASRRAGNYSTMLLLTIVFATLHFSYGFGFLVGLIRFANRWQIGTNPK